MGPAGDGFPLAGAAGFPVAFCMAKILVVDDEVTMVQMVTELLRSEGHEVYPYSNGDTALDGLE